MMELMMTMNTAHVHPSTLVMLDTCGPDDGYGLHVLAEPRHYVVHPLDAVRPEPLGKDYPDLLAAVRAAAALGANALCLDGDAKPCPGLPLAEAEAHDGVPG